MDAVWAWLEAGGAVLASHAGLAQTLAAEHDRRQQAAGRRSWPRAAIETLDAWLGRVWAGGGDRLLLTSAQERRLWEAVIPTFAEAPLLDTAATAEMAAEAWKLAQGWQLDFACADWGASEDTIAFGGWAVKFVRELRHNVWITAAELPAAVSGELRRGRVRPPERLALVGFDELNPAQLDLVAALRDAGALVELFAPQREPAVVTVVPALNGEHELELAARWARDLLDRGARGTIGVVIAGLESQRAAAQRIFMSALHPGRDPWSPAPRAFHISLGQPLAQYPLVGAALAALELFTTREPIALAPALNWMRSPFIQGAATKGTARAGLAQWLRSKQRARWTWSDVQREVLARCAQLANAMRHGRDTTDAWPKCQDHRGWAASFAAFWEAIGWPGERPLTSAEFQTRQTWERLLDDFRRLDQVAPRAITLNWAQRRLKRLAAARIFQPQAAAAPVEILGWLEAAGREFSHLRVLGLHDAALPAPAAPHPFLPLEWQRQQALPRSSAEQEAAFATRIWERLRRSAAEITASFPVRAGDEELRPSPLLAGFPHVPEAPVPQLNAAAPLETLEDRAGPALSATQNRGRSEVFTEQSACPFRAFVHLRLKARTPPPLPEGLAATTRGQLLHALLRVVWSLLHDHVTLLATPEAELRALVEEKAAILAGEEPCLHGLPGLAALERDRLAATTLAWLEIEKARAPFAIEALEQASKLGFAGLDLSLRLDRVDQLADGSLALLDYKSGVHSRGEWNTPRMREPQLPLYLVTHPERERIVALAFAQLRPGEMRLVPVERTPGTLGVNASQASAAPSWEDQLALWRHELERVAEEYRTGLAWVDPLDPKTTCKYCDLHPVCRIHEVLAAAGNGEDGEDEEDGDAD